MNLKTTLSLTTVLCLLGSCGSIGCTPELPPSPCSCGESLDEEDLTTLSVTSVPQASLDSAPPVLRLRIDLSEESNLAEGSLVPEDFFLISGEATSAHLGQLERGEISNALSERIVSSVRWTDASGSVFVAPTEILDPGAGYTLASGAHRLAVPVTISEEDVVPTLDRLWPPPDCSSSLVTAVWCGEEYLPEDIAMPMVLDPSGASGSIRAGSVGSGAGRRCVHLESASPPSDEMSLVAPPYLEADGGVIARLDPRAIEIQSPLQSLVPLACQPSEQPFGAGCAQIMDDRLKIVSPDAPLLWTISGADTDYVGISDSGEPFMLMSLPPNSDVTLEIVTTDTAGTDMITLFSAHTKPPMAHVVINEILANPIGVEPDQEWVEIYNDGAVSADLAGYMLTDVGGETILPGGTLDPGQFALVVGEDYDETDDLDAQPPPGAMLIRVADLGKNGLNNQGEPLKLFDSDGNLISRYYGTPKPKAGLSVMRVTPSAPDELERSFVVAPEAPTPAAPNNLDG